MNTGQTTLESMSQAVWYNQWTLNKFSHYLKGNILEVGCGIGSFTNVLTKFGNVYAIDIEKTYVTKTTKNSKAHVGFGDIENGKYFFKNKTFDSIICLNVLEHIEDDVKALKNIYSLLKKDGYFILLVPSHKFLYGSIDQSIGHFRRYEKNRLVAQLKKQNFEVIESRKINSLGAIGWWVSGKVLHSKTVSEGRLRLFNIVAPTILKLEDFLEPPFGTSILLIAKK